MPKFLARVYAFFFGEAKKHEVVHYPSLSEINTDSADCRIHYERYGVKEHDTTE